MEKKDRGFKIIAVLALLIAVVGLSVAYAGYTSTLTFDATANVASAWKVIWKDLSAGSTTGYATLDGKTVAIDSTNQAISGVLGTLKAPGDTITYTWKAANDGDIDASITGVTVGTLSCAPKSGVTPAATQAQADALCAKLSVAFTYDGSALTSETRGDLLKNTSKNVSMTLTYAAGDAVAIDGDVVVTIGRTSITYEQKATS